MGDEWPFLDAVDGPEGIIAYEAPSTLWETLRLTNTGTGEVQLPIGHGSGEPPDWEWLGEIFGALDVGGACVIRGDAFTRTACARLACALESRPLDEMIVKGVAQRYPDSYPLLAHPVHLKVCAGALGRQLLRVPTLDELSARMCLPSTFTGGVSFKQMPFELDYARASITKPTKLQRPHLGAAFVPAVQDLENQLTCFWVVGGEPAAMRFVSGSHRWALGREADESSVVEVVLHPGDSLVCASGLYRAVGSHGSLVLEVGYHLSFWQTEEENQMAIGSPSAALLMPRHISRLCGWCKPGDILNKQYSGGDRADPLGAAIWLGDRPLDWAGHVWTPDTATATPRSLKVAADDWCGPQEYCDGSLRWEDYPTRFGELELPLSDPGALTSIEWPGPGTSKQRAVETIEQCLAVLARDGAVILAHAVTHQTMDAYMESVRAYNEESTAAPDGDGPAECGSVLARSTAVLPLVAHPCVMGVCEGVLGRQVLTMDQPELVRRLRLAGGGDTERIPWQLQVQAFIGKGPRQGPQLLHRDGEYAMFQLPAEQIEHEISCIWATHDFTSELGATRVVKGSHRWPRQRQPSVKESIGAEMPKGSVVIYAGHTLHGAGANTTEEWVRINSLLLNQLPLVGLSCRNSAARVNSLLDVLKFVSARSFNCDYGIPRGLP